MLKSKALEIFRSFSPDELKRFRSFIISPFHNTNKNVVKLFDLAKKHYPAFESKSLNKEELFRKLYPGKKYNDIVMRIFNSDLLRLAEEFLTLISIGKDPVASKNYLLSELLARRIVNLFDQNIKETEKLLKVNGIDESYFYCKFETEELRKGLNVILDKQHLNEDNLVKIAYCLVGNYLIKMSSAIYEIKVNKDNFNIAFNEKVISAFSNLLDQKEMKNLLGNKGYEDNDILELYYYSYLINTGNPDDKYFYRIRELLNNNEERIQFETRYNIYMTLLNYCGLRMWHSHDNKYAEEEFSIYKEMLEKGLHSYSEDSYMTIIMFRSILLSSARLRDFIWQEQFIKNYVEKLAPEQRENMLHYATAKLNFSKKNYGEALDQINKVKFKLFAFKFDVRSLTLQIYYEMNYYEQARSLMDSFRHFCVNNKSVSEKFRGWNLNFLNLYSLLLDRKNGAGKADLKALGRKLDDTPNVACRNWLEDKIEELTGG